MVEKLKQEEVNLAKELWKEVFVEDSSGFIEYYFATVGQANEIYGVKTGAKELISMVHLNPYRIRAGYYRGEVAYIVGVATKEEYRGQGYMSCTLKRALEREQSKKAPFTFLMPVNPSIYTPFDFRLVVQKQPQVIVSASNTHKEIKKATENDVDKMADFANAYYEEMAKKVGGNLVCTLRSPKYYQRMIQEQQSENGEIFLVYDKGELEGMCYCFLEKEKVEVREPLYIGRHCDELFAGIQNAICPKQKVSIHLQGQRIMARVIHLPTFFQCFIGQRDSRGTLYITDKILPQNEGLWEIQMEKNKPINAKLLERKITEKRSEISVATLLEILVAQKDENGCWTKKYTNLDEESLSVLQGIEPWREVFLHEVV